MTSENKWGFRESLHLKSKGEIPMEQTFNDEAIYEGVWEPDQKTLQRAIVVKEIEVACLERSLRRLKAQLEHLKEHCK